MVTMGEFFHKSGFEVHVVASQGIPIDYFGYQNIINKLFVHYVPDPYQRFYNKSTSQSFSGKQSASQKKIYRLLRSIVPELTVPDQGVFYAWGLYRRALNIILRENIKNIVSSSPPHSTQVAALLLKRRLKDRINLIVDYRDSWNTTALFSKRLHLIRAKNKAIEQRVLQAADLLTFASPPMIDKINNNFPGIVRRSQLVMNGYDDRLSLPKRRSHHQRNHLLTIGHFGAISDSSHSFRNPAQILDASRHLPRPVRFVFYGDATISPRWKKLLGERLILGGTIPHQRAFEEMQKVDVLMLVHSNPLGADEVITSKIYEYMLSGRPIAVFGPPTMEAIKIVHRHNLGYSANILDPFEVKKTLICISDDWLTNSLFTYPPSVALKYNRVSQYKKILPFLL